ncbi:MAG: alpha/beta hydrolase, partial [Acidimicrobiales bacterium]
MPDDTGPPIETFSLRTSDGLALEAEARIPADATIAALLAHPHPLHGGSMRSLVTSELFRSLPERGVAVVRFNFRGVEGSHGTHGQGVDEQHDLVAGLDALTERVPGLPLVILGWSFGADVGLTVVDPRLAGWFLIAPPI